MTNRNVGWPPSARMCFGSLDFIVTTEVDLVWAPILVPPSPTIGLDNVIEAFEELHLHSSTGHA
jgi:hypothetical protein